MTALGTGNRMQRRLEKKEQGEQRLGLLILHLTEKWKGFEPVLAGTARGRNIPVLILEKNETDIFWDQVLSGGKLCVWHDGRLADEVLREQVLVVTDQMAEAQRFADCGIACIGCAREADGYFEGAGMVTDAPEQLGLEEMEEYLFHCNGWPVQIAETERLILREMTQSDRGALQEISRQEGMEYVQNNLNGDFFECETFQAYIVQIYRLQGYGLWSVCKKDGTLIGCCGLADVRAADGTYRLELQYMLSRTYQRQGFGTEMCFAALDYVFARTDWTQVWLRIHSNNEASVRLARRLGAICETDGMVQEWRIQIQKCFDADHENCNKVGVE